MRSLLFFVGAFAGSVWSASSTETEAEPWEAWLENFGHDAYKYPAWISSQQADCECEVADLPGGKRQVTCRNKGELVDWHGAADLTWCVAMHFSLSHMPEFDLDFLPGAVSVEGENMLDDNIAFSLMAWNASRLSPRPPLEVALPYLLPYASYHEARANWRPIFFAKYFKGAAAAPNATSSKAVLQSLIGGGTRLMNWTSYSWASNPKSSNNVYELGPFSPSTAPPVVAPFDFAAYGYGSCTAWSTFLASALKAVGVPARQVGTPCWNTGAFAGSAAQNPNVSLCWAAAGSKDGPFGGEYLHNHNWVEYWDNELGDWEFVDVAVSAPSETTWFCGQYSKDTGCPCNSDAGQAAQDHEIFAPTWSDLTSDDSMQVDGGPVLDVADLKLSSGEAASPLVWNPRLTSPRGKALRNVGLRVVNRTSYYRCRQPPTTEVFA